MDQATPVIEKLIDGIRRKAAWWFDEEHVEAIRVHIQQALLALDARDRMVVAMWAGGASAPVIAAAMGSLSRERARQAVSKGLRRLYRRCMRAAYCDLAPEDTPLWVMDLSVRGYNGARNAQCETLGDLAKWRPFAGRSKNLGKATLREYDRVLAEMRVDLPDASS